jgi:hypothetical protein
MATINGTFNSLIAGTLSGTVATPGATGPAGPAGPAGPTGSQGIPGVGVPVGGTAGQVLAKVDGVNYNTEWIDQSAPDFISSVSAPLAVTSGNLTVNLAGYATETFVTSQGYITSAALVPYLTKADNLGSLTNFATARDNLNLGTLNTPTFAGLTLQGSGANVGQYTPTSLSLTHTTLGSFVISPSSGITFPDTSVQTTAFVTGSGLPTGGTVGQVLTKNSGSNFDASFATLIPGDRYLTTSTTSLTINNDNKTLTVGTGLSYTPQQDVVIAYDAANHMHAQVLTYNSGTGVMTVDVRSHSGSGTFTFWTVNVGGTVPEASVSWGSITGTLGNQTDLATALNGKLEVTTAASTYQTLAGMSSYLTTSAAASTYLTQANAASTYFTVASAAGKANLSGATFTGKVNFTPVSGVAGLNVGIGGTAVSSPTAGDLWIATSGSILNYRDGAAVHRLVAAQNLTNTFSSPQIIDTTNSTPALRVTQKGTGNAIQVEDSTTPDSTPFVVDQFGKVGIGVAPDSTAALKVDTNGIMFGDDTVQTTAAVPFVYVAPSKEASLEAGDQRCVITPSQISVEDTLNSVSVGISSYGVRFSDNTVQTTAATSGIPDAPSDGNHYVRKDGAWVQCTVVSIYDSNSMQSYNCLTV